MLVKVQVPVFWDRKSRLEVLQEICLQIYPLLVASFANILSHSVGFLFSVVIFSAAKASNFGSSRLLFVFRVGV